MGLMNSNGNRKRKSDELVDNKRRTPPQDTPPGRGSTTPPPERLGCLASLFSSKTRRGNGRGGRGENGSGCLLPALLGLLGLAVLALLVLFLFGSLPSCGGAGAGGGSPQPPVTPAVEVTEGSYSYDDLQVYYLDLGQGDATLVLCEGMSMLIDTGNEDSAEQLDAYLSRLNIRHLDYLVLTRPHDNHCGAVASVLQSYSPDTILYSTEDDGNLYFSFFLDYATSHTMNRLLPAVGTRFYVGSAVCDVLAVCSTDDETAPASLVVRLTYGEKSFLFMGDAGQQTERSVLSYCSAQGVPTVSDVLKVSNHGAGTSTGDDFLAAVTPAYAVTSVGSADASGFPADTTLNKLSGRGISLYRTDTDGTILISSDGSDLRLTTHVFG